MKTITENRKAYFNYIVEDDFTCGISLKGCEIKSIRRGEINISDSYCMFGGKNNL